MAKVKINIEVDYNEETVNNSGLTIEDIENNLKDNILNHVGNGMLTEPDHELEVDSYYLNIEE